MNRHQPGEFVPVRGTPMEREQRLREALLQEERAHDERDRTGRGGGERERGGGDMFAAFLEADEQSRQMAAAQREIQQATSGPGSSGLDWPTAPVRTGSTGGGTSSRAILDAATQGQGGAPSGSWFDLFTGGGASGGSANVLGGSLKDSAAPLPSSEPLGQDIAHALAASAGSAAGDGSESQKSAENGKSTGGQKQTGTREPSDTEDADGEDDVDMEGSAEAKPDQRGGGAPNQGQGSTATRATRSKANGKAKV